MFAKNSCYARPQSCAEPSYNGGLKVSQRVGIIMLDTADNIKSSAVTVIVDIAEEATAQDEPCHFLRLPLELRSIQLNLLCYNYRLHKNVSVTSLAGVFSHQKPHSPFSWLICIAFVNTRIRCAACAFLFHYLI